MIKVFSLTLLLRQKLAMNGRFNDLFISSKSREKSGAKEEQAPAYVPKAEWDILQAAVMRKCLEILT